jgi:hypothetical protein
MPNMDVPYCTSEIRKAIVEMNSAHNDGYVSLGSQTRFVSIEVYVG